MIRDGRLLASVTTKTSSFFASGASPGSFGEKALLVLYLCFTCLLMRKSHFEALDRRCLRTRLHGASTTSRTDEE
ncbi:MAG: hypothetical protein ACI8PG_001110 [Planctomycetota bacterium]|jgi:hypothetical protein